MVEDSPNKQSAETHPAPDTSRTLSSVTNLDNDQVQSLANILSFVAILGRMETTAIQRVLITLGSDLNDVTPSTALSPHIVQKLFTAIAAEQGNEPAMEIASDLAFVSRAWQPALQTFLDDDPYRLMPYAEIIFSLLNYSGSVLLSYEAFERFGGADFVLPMKQLAAALKPYNFPEVNLSWEMVGFKDPPDTAIVASSADTIYLLKAASSGIDLRFSELERDTDSPAKREHDVRVDTPIFASFVAGLLGDMLYWTALLRSHALPGRRVWQNIQALLYGKE